MARKVSTNISLDLDLKNAGQELYSSLGLDLSTVVAMMIIQSLRVHGLPFQVVADTPNEDTIAAFREYDEIKSNPDKYKRYSSFAEAVKGEIEK